MRNRNELADAIEALEVFQQCAGSPGFSSVNVFVLDFVLLQTSSHFRLTFIFGAVDLDVNVLDNLVGPSAALSLGLRNYLDHTSGWEDTCLVLAVTGS